MRLKEILGLITLASAFLVSSGSSINPPERTGIPLSEPHQYEHVRERRLSENDAKKPLNVILLLVNKLSRGDLNSRADLQNTEIFPVQGFLKGCTENGKSCECAETLKNNIAHLLSWAGKSKGIATSVLYEAPTSGPTVQRRRRSDIKDDSNVSEMMQKLKESFSQTMMRSLQEGNTEGEAKASSNIRRANFWDLAGRTLEDLNRISNDGGYIMVATATADELTEALELLESRATENTLVVVTSMCPESSEDYPVKLYARGPLASKLNGPIRSLPELPNVIREILIDHECAVSPDKCDKEREKRQQQTQPQGFFNRSFDRRRIFKRQEEAAEGGAGADATQPAPADPTEGGSQEGQESQEGDAGDSTGSTSGGYSIRPQHFSSIVFTSAVVLTLTKIIKY